MSRMPAFQVPGFTYLYAEWVGRRPCRLWGARVQQLAFDRDREAYRPDIHGLRAVAIVMVVGYHVGLPGFAGGFVGVDVFSVISGTSSWACLAVNSARPAASTGWAFDARRVRRLVPAAVVLFVGILILSNIIMTPLGDRQDLAKSVIAAAGFGLNFDFGNGCRSITSPYRVRAHRHCCTHGHSRSKSSSMLHFRSVSYWREQSLSRKKRLSQELPFGARVRVHRRLARLCRVVGGSVSSAGFFSPVTRARPIRAWGTSCSRRPTSILLGSAKFGRTRRHRHGCVVLGLAAANCRVPSGWALIPSVGTSLVILAGRQGTSVTSRLLSRRTPVSVGRISYGWYLWHWPMLMLGATYNLGPPAVGVRAMLAFVALGLAVLLTSSWKCPFGAQPEDPAVVRRYRVDGRPR